MADKRLLAGPVTRVHIQGIEPGTGGDPMTKLVGGPVERVHIQSIEPGVVLVQPADVPYDPGDTGMSAGDVQAALDELASQIAAIGQPASSPVRGTYLVSGGRLIYSGSGYEYTVTGGSGYIDGTIVTWTEQDVILGAADATNDRIDVFKVDASGLVTATQGTPAANPSKPDVDPMLYLSLTFAIVYANTTDPTGATEIVIYADNLGSPNEWTHTPSAGTIVIDSTTDPRVGLKCIRATNAIKGTTLTSVGDIAFDPAVYDALTLYLKITEVWNNKGSLVLQWYNGTAKVGSPVVIKPGENGLVATDVSTYQAQSFLMSQFAIPVGALIDRLVITIAGATVSFAMDTVQLQDQTNVSNPSTSGMTIEEADARYLRRDLALTDLDSTNPRIKQKEFVIGGGASEIADGVVKGDPMWEFSGTLLSWTMLADQAGAIKVDIWKDTYANFPPTDADSICNGHEPEITAGNAKAQDTNLSDWSDVTIAAGDIWRFNVDSCTTITCVNLIFKVLV